MPIKTTVGLRVRLNRSSRLLPDDKYREQHPRDRSGKDSIDNYRWKAEVRNNITIPDGALGTIGEFTWNKVTGAKMKCVVFDDYPAPDDCCHGLGETYVTLPEWLEVV